MKLFPNIVTSRSESRSRDNIKVDLINFDEYKNGKLPFNFQCKNSCRGVNYYNLFKSMPDDEAINCILHRYTEKSKTGKFITKGEYAILNMSDFINLLSKICEK